jgi:hypothetical protein
MNNGTVLTLVSMVAIAEIRQTTKKNLGKGIKLLNYLGMFINSYFI